MLVERLFIQPLEGGSPPLADQYDEYSTAVNVMLIYLAFIWPAGGSLHNEFSTAVNINYSWQFIYYAQLTDPI